MIKRLYGYLGKHKKTVWFCIMLTVLEVVLELSIPLLMGRIVDNGIPSGDLRYIALNGVLMVVMAVAAICMGVLNANFSAKSSQAFAANLRKALYDKTQTFSFAGIDRFASSSLITRMTSDITQLQNTLMMGLRMLTRSPIMLISAFLIATTINFKLSLIIIAAIVILAIGILLVMRTAGKLFAALQKSIDGLNASVQEDLIAIRVVKAFVRENHERQKFKNANDTLTNTGIKAGYVASLLMPVSNLVLYATMIAVIWIGGSFVGAGYMSTGELITFLSYIMNIIVSVMMFAMILFMVTRAKACAERAFEVLDADIDVADNKEVMDFPGRPRVKKGRIEFQNVSFKYNGGGMGLNVLSDVSFTIEPGELVGIVGGTGSGKTSLINLISRFYDVIDGKVCVDGADVRDYIQADLRDGIGMVMQKSNLFSGTIRENLLWGNSKACDAEIIKAAKDAQAHEFIDGFPNGYDTVLGQGGVNVSGGQKQRLCIARAMLKKPPILILDDATSAVDMATETKIRSSFYDNFKDSTVIIVAQRISSVMDADKIIVLDKGRISGIGTHDELLAGNDVYSEIYSSQVEGGR